MAEAMSQQENMGFYQKAENYFFSPKTPKAEQPYFIFVFASPGAGKSTNIKPLLKEQFKEKPVIIEVDELKSFIPASQDIDKTANDWFIKLVDKAISEKRHIVIFRQRNMLKPQQTQRLYQKAKKAGYITQAKIVALDKVRSRLGIIHRFEHAVDTLYQDETSQIENYPRKPDFIKHYIFYQALPIITDICSRSDLVDIVEVYDRERNKIAWQNKLTGENSLQTPLQALKRERTRAWAPWEKEKFNRRCKEAKAKMKMHRRSWVDFMKFKLLTFTTKNK